MERYLLFRGRYYYPSGGFGDFVGDFDDLEKAIKANEDDILKDFNPNHESKDEYIEYEKSYSWGHIIDSISKTEVWSQD